MRIKQTHIILFLLVVSTLSLQFTNIDSNFYLETETEESINDIDELESEEDRSASDSDGGKNAVASIQNSLSHHLFSWKSNSLFCESTDLSQRPQLFILYCCLKLDC
jgi:hypothetical protein